MGNKDHRLKAAGTVCHPRSPIGSSDGKREITLPVPQGAEPSRRKYEPMLGDPSLGIPPDEPVGEQSFAIAE